MSVEEGLTPRERGYLAGLARKALAKHEEKIERIPQTVKDPADLPRITRSAEAYREFLEGVVEKTAPWHRKRDNGQRRLPCG